MARGSGRPRRTGVGVALLAMLGVLSVAACGGSDDDAGAEEARRERPTSGSTGPTGSDEAGTTAPPETTAPPAPPAGGTGTTGATDVGRDDEWWRPRRGLTWQWQLDAEPIDTSVEADVYDIDLFETPPETIQALHDQGRRVICYFSAGSWEPYRPDAGDFPNDVIGGPVEGWPDERWLDIRRLDTLRPLVAARLDLCAEKGADAVEPDWMDNHIHDTGWDITAEDQLAFNRMIADMAHERGLAVGLKNDLPQVAELADTFDFAVVEQCAEFDECHLLQPFLDRDKPVFHAEYDLPTSAFCAESRRLGLSSIRKRLELDAWRQTC